MRVTRRGWAVAALALLFYFFANQTQVGWLYVFSALATGLWLTTLTLPGRMLRGLTVTRRVNGSETGADLELHAGQAVTIELMLHNASRLTALPFGDLAAAGAAIMGAASVPLFFLFAVLVLVLAGWLFWLGWRQVQRARPVGFAAIDGDANRRRILAAYRVGQRRLKRLRRPSETPSEFARRVGQADWHEVTLAAEQAAYRPRPPASSLAQKVQRLVNQLHR